MHVLELERVRSKDPAHLLPCSIAGTRVLIGVVENPSLSKVQDERTNSQRQAGQWDIVKEEANE
jgi:hypothetical protein